MKVIVKTLYLSVDPAQRCQMNVDTGVAYMLPWQIDDVITGLGSCTVVESRNSKFKKGKMIFKLTFFSFERFGFWFLVTMLFDSTTEVFFSGGIIWLLS